jgi:hypothetical protein
MKMSPDDVHTLFLPFIASRKYLNVHLPAEPLKIKGYDKEKL